MQNDCGDCLAQEVCDITGASCQKMGALFIQRKQTRNGRTTMSNTAKNSATPKTVAEAAEKINTEETTVPAQAQAPTESKGLDKVVDRENKTLFAGTPSEVLAWLKERSNEVHVIRRSGNHDLISSEDYVKKHLAADATAEKLSLVQRLKATAEKLKNNRKSQVLLVAAVFCAGVAIKKSRNLKAVDMETLDSDDTTINEVGEDDGSTDSI